MFRKSRRTTGRHTEAYLSRRTAETVPTQETGSTDLAAAPTDAEVHPEPALDGALHGASDEAAPAADAEVVCARCEELIAGDELEALRSRRAAGAA